MPPLGTAVAVVGTADAWASAMGATHVGAVFVTVVGAMEARGLRFHDSLRAHWGAVVANVFGLARHDTAFTDHGGLRLRGFGAEFAKDITTH